MTGQPLALRDLIKVTPKDWADNVFEKQWAYVPRDEIMMEDFELPMSSTTELMALLGTSYVSFKFPPPLSLFSLTLSVFLVSTIEITFFAQLCSIVS